MIDIFAKSDAQRLDLADYVIDKMKGSWTYYTHEQSSGDRKELSLTDQGEVKVTEFVSNRKVDFDGGTELFDKFRHAIVLNVRKSKLGV